MRPLRDHINMLTCIRIMLLLIFIWFTLVLFNAYRILESSSVHVKLGRRLHKVLADIESLKVQNAEFHTMLKDIVNVNASKNDVKEPNLQYEQLRRQLSTNTREFWYFMHSGLLDIEKRMLDVVPEDADAIKELLNLGEVHRNSLLKDIDHLAEVDGYAAWREKESKELSNLVQKRFISLQHPADCNSTTKMLCDLDQACGFGCQLHHAVYCFILAYGTKHTLILQSKYWSYNDKGWDEIFQPISYNCTHSLRGLYSEWPGRSNNDDLILPLVNVIKSRPSFLPLAIPEDLAPRLTILHGNPIVWWIGQIAKYFLRPQPKTAAIVQKMMDRVGFTHPIVGIHVRRTDKIDTEASFHSIEEYMIRVENYYRQLKLKQVVHIKRVYLATDDPNVIVEAKKKYPDYEILGDQNISKSANKPLTRYSNSSLFGLITDIQALALSDYIVCTFSSQVCRLAYELMQTYHSDASSRFFSLDDIYYFGGQSQHNNIAVMAHETNNSNEINLKVGDLIEVAGNHWNGFSKGKNLRTRRVGLYPSFKVKDIIKTAKFPDYSKIEN